MPAVETGQMSAVETGQMSAAETGQMFVNVEKPMVFFAFFYRRGPFRHRQELDPHSPGEGADNKNPSLALSGKTWLVTVAQEHRLR